MSDIDDKDFEIRAPYLQKILDLEAELLINKSELARKAYQCNKLTAYVLLIQTNPESRAKLLTALGIRDELIAPLKEIKND